MPDSPAVTVIVPGRDVAAYAVEALDSLRAQSRPDWTAILVDDGSLDDTGAIFRRAAHDDSRFRVIANESPRGLGAARNLALDLVRTPFTAFLDADDVARPGMLATALAALDDSGSELVIGAYVRLRPDEHGGYERGDVQPWVAAATAPARRHVSLAEHPDVTGSIVAWAKVSRTRLWHRERLRFPEGRLYEDQVIAQLLHTRARGIDTVPDVFVDWRVRAEGTSITQREAEPAVLRDCLDQMLAGLAVLDDGHPQAAAARRAQIERMDLPRLDAIAATHPDEEYRRTLDAFTVRLRTPRG